MIHIEKRIVNTTKKYSGVNGKKFVVIHQTGNTRVGANAEAHHDLQAKGNVRNASWHISVDDKVVIQSFTHDVRCWHAGDGDAPNGGNYNGIAIEICINQDGDYVQAVKNGAEVARQVLHELNLPLSALKQHHYFSGKNCPAQIRANKDGIDWNDFVALVERASVEKPQSTPKRKSIATMAQEVIRGLHGSGHETRRKSLGVSASEYEKVRAEVNRLAGVKVAVKPSKSIAQMAEEVINGLHGNGHETRRKSLGIDASEYAKVRAEVNKRL